MVPRHSNSREQLLRHLIIFIALQSAAAGTFLCPGLNCTEGTWDWTGGGLMDRTGRGYMDWGWVRTGRGVDVDR